MNDRKTELRRAIDKAQRTAFFKDLRPRTAWPILLLAIVVLLIAYMSFSPALKPRLRETVTGYGVSESVTFGKLSTGLRSATVRLENGRTVTIEFPKSETFRTDVPMKIKIYDRSWGPIHQEIERFAGYVEPGDVR